MSGTGELPPGVYRLAKKEPVHKVHEAASRRGWHSIELAGKEINSKATFLAACAQAFRFPEWFGANWDALHDCLCDLSWLEPAPGILVVYDHADSLAAVDPRSFSTALEILESACEWWAGRGMSFVVLVRGAPRGFPLRRMGRRL